MQTAMDPSTRFVRSLDGEYFMLREAAEILGVSPRTLRRLNEATREEKDEANYLGPSNCTYFGKVRIYLYTTADVDKIRKHLDAAKVVLPMKNQPKLSGRPRKWTTAQRRERQRLYSRVHYYRGRATDLAAQGHDAEAALAQAEVEAALKALEDM